MLRASADTEGLTVELRGVVDPTIDTGVEGGAELIAFADALVGADADSLGPARDDLVFALGPEAASRAALVCGNFQMMNVLVDATGIPVSAQAWRLADELGVERPPG